MQTATISTRDADHLKLLSVFHYVVAGFALLGIGFLVVHFLFFKMFFANPEMWKNANSAPMPFSPAEFFALFKWFYVFMGAVLVLASILNCLSAILLRQRRHHTFSMVVAGLNCLQIPLGTILGVFTIVVLCRDSVRASYNP